jgi:DNA-binding transcriptional MocR family regulator
MSWTTSSQLDQSDLLPGLRSQLRDGRGSLRDRLGAGLLEAIETGRLPVGARLPSERLLADEMGVSRGTVVAAMDHLVALGHLERRQGSGTYVRSAPVVAGGHDDGRLIDFWMRHSTPLDLAISSTVEAPTGLLGPLEATALLTAQPTHGYSAVGERHMREAAARHLTRMGMPTTGDEVMVTTGAQQALGLAIESLVRPGDRVLVESPTYPGLLALIRRAGARPVPLRTDEHGVIPADLSRAIDEGGPALLCTVPIGSNPTGAVMSPGRREALLDIVVRHGIAVLEDLTLADLVFDDVEVGHPLNASPDVEGVVTGSTSKTLWGGLRVGWLRADEPWFSRFVQTKALQDFGTSPITQHVAAQMLRGIEADDDWMPNRRKELSERRNLLIDLLNEALPQWGVSRPSGGLSLWVRLPGTDTTAFAEAADRHGVHVMPGEQCATDGDYGDHIRMCFDRDPVVLREAVSRLAGAYSEFSRSRTPQRVLLRP